MVAFTKKEQFFPCRSNTKLLPPIFGLAVVVLLQRKTCTYDSARNIVDKFSMTGLFNRGGRGSPQRIMQPWKVAYLEALVTHDPFMYLSEIQKALRDNLNLPAAEIPSIPTICRTLISLDLTRHKAAKVPLERFNTPEQSSTNGFCGMEKNC